MDSIYRYLRKAEKEGKVIQGLKTFFPREPRTKSLIERLDIFTEGVTIDDIKGTNDSFLNQPNPEWNLYRRLALLAINQFIKDFPFLMHTPSSLRSIFGMPTRKDRKRGKFSGKDLIEQALSETQNVEISTDFESVEELIECLQEVKNPVYQSECDNLVKYLKNNLSRNSLADTYVPELSTHSIDSLNLCKTYLENSGFNSVIHEAEDAYPYGTEEENKLLTPDIICEIWNNPVWFELKEWTNFNIFLSPLKQLLTYLQANIRTKKSNEKSYIGILVENKVEFFQFLLDLGESIKLKKLKDILKPTIEEVITKSDEIHDMRTKFLKLGRILITKYNLQIKAEALYLGLIAEFINKNIGMTNTEVEAGKVILEILNDLELNYNTLRILPVDHVSKYDVPEENLVIFLGVIKP